MASARSSARRSTLLVVSAICIALLAAGAATALTIDFSGPANGTALTGTEFAGVAISSSDTGVTHLGPTIFDSAPAGPNAAGGDPDFLVDLGNIAILQNTAYPTQTTAGIFDTPDDDADFGPNYDGHLLFTFDTPVEVLAITLIDINGGALVDITLTDSEGDTLQYFVPEMWTFDVNTCGTCDGYAEIDLTTLLAQSGEAGTTVVTPAPTMTGDFDGLSVETLELRFHGSSPSAAVDNLTYVPEPGTALLFGLGLVGLAAARRRA